MNELNNPLFEDKREFLERQKQEYKNALLGDVAELKNQSQEIGKKVLIGGGALVGVWLLSKMLRGGGGRKKKSKALKTGLQKQLTATTTRTAAAGTHRDGIAPDNDNYNYQAGQVPPVSSFYQPQSPQPSFMGELTKAFMESEMAKALSTQITAFLLVYVTKKLEDYLQVPKNPDIVVTKEPETRDIDFSYHEEDAV
ncbi:hypothetical protein HUW51_07545 [Adhaeribacter swui]|uniref:Uncharacterized protein n=1 Tax=Adhaeribacter swui TaxID=2086471 RepID=A0A7G7G605_9BACT|nr:hypothetical protein [Adhaeribacter swui]QNF32589.1 hypothetical protein HUW51_07545 [Adhaeribacter swui]